MLLHLSAAESFSPSLVFTRPPLLSRNDGAATWRARLTHQQQLWVQCLAQGAAVDPN